MLKHDFKALGSLLGLEESAIKISTKELFLSRML